MRSLLATCFVLVSPSALMAATNFTQILGQPTDRSVTVSVRSDTAVEVYFEYGVTTGTYTGQTKSTALAADPFAGGFYVLQTTISGLTVDTQYFYRMEFRTAGSTGAYTPGQEYSFHTQRLPGSSFTFVTQGDSHPEREKTMFNPVLYNQTLTAVAAEHPDFYITNGDDFSVDTLPTPYTQPAITGRYTLQLPYFDLMARGTPLFLGTGNHEETSLSNYNLPNDSANSNQVPIWAQNARNTYYAVPGPNDPVTGTFYSGNTTTIPKIGMLRDYYAWQWGDALFMVIDPYWGSPAQVDTGLGGQSSTTPKSQDKWAITHGDAQYLWMKQTLEHSKAKWKFIFAHHVMGTNRGGTDITNQYEWGGVSGDGTWGLAKNRPTWMVPIHQLLVANKVTVFFQAHDHLFARQQIDGVVYQSLPNPADNTYTAFNADAYVGADILPNAGYVKVSVSPDNVRVDYIREWLPADVPANTRNGSVQFSYTINPPSAPQPAIAGVSNAAGGNSAVALNTWVEIDGTNLSPTGKTRVWGAADFVKGELPQQIDGVSVSVNGKAAYIYYISPTQINVLTNPEPMSGPVEVRVTVNGSVSTTYTGSAQPVSPGFFPFGGSHYVAATHVDGTYLGPASLYPELTTPAKPGETIVLYANGFGAVSKAVIPGSPTQAGTLAKLPAMQIGGLNATVQFAGLISPGLFQFNVVVPAAAPDGDLSVTATYNGTTTQTGTLLTVKK